MFPSRIVKAAAAVWVASALMTGCGGGKPPAEGPRGAQNRPRSSTPATVQHRQPLTKDDLADWQDPEPPDAQARAEAVVNAPFNADKTTRLVMHITTIVDRTTGIRGFATTLEPETASLEERLNALGAKETETEVTIRLPGAILFDFDSSAIRPDAERTLTEVVKVLAAYPGRPIRVEGHTDSIASEAYNQKLSEARAKAVAEWLAGHGVDPSRLKIKGWGETRPVADNATPEGRQQNRRVEVVIEKRPSST